MNLIIDQGNTYSKIAIFNETNQYQVSKLKNSNIYEIEDIIQSKPIERAILSSVADDSSLLDILKKQSINFHQLSSESKLPIQLDYETPSSLGLDRLAAAIGAHIKNKDKTSLIIDIGTAVTYDICTKDGLFIGGSIAPGLNMRLQALHSFTKRLPLVEREWPKNHWAKSTNEALQNGAQIGIIAEINHYIKTASDDFGDISVFLTGGDAIFFEKKIKSDIFVDPNLVIEGLFEILKIN